VTIGCFGLFKLKLPSSLLHLQLVEKLDLVGSLDYDSNHGCGRFRRARCS
jgi:hypothetical protein